MMVSEEVVEKYDREMDRRTRQNLERFAEFMARMIEKYGHKVLAEILPADAMEKVRYIVEPRMDDEHSLGNRKGGDRYAGSFG